MKYLYAICRKPSGSPEHPSCAFMRRPKPRGKRVLTFGKLTRQGAAK